MKSRLTWNEDKRRNNLEKHGLDFADAAWVLDSDIRLDIAIWRNGEHRIHSFAYVFDQLMLLALVHMHRGGTIRVISFRSASKEESEEYHAWLESPDQS